MKSIQIISIVAVAFVTSSKAFTPATNSRTSFSIQTSQPSSKTNTAKAPVHKDHNAAFAAFATAMTPIVVQATEVDEGTVVGVGAGLVACIVSLAVGFSIGYGTLV